MTFELSSDQQTVRDRARALATERIQSHAAEIDQTSAIPTDLARDAAALIASSDLVAAAVAIEAMAAASGAVAVDAIAGPKRSGSYTLSGLRGAGLPDNSPRAQLLLAAVALGLGRAARDAALAELREATAHPGKGDEKPHWVVADAATELEAARLLTLAAAQAMDAEDALTAVAMARLAASAAASTVVDAALRVAGPDGYRPGTLLERLARDVRAVSLMLGTEEQHRATAAEGLLPGQ